jgi:hypothetical protein
MCGYPIQVWYLSLFNEHSMFKLIGMILSCLLGIYGSCNGEEVESALWFILYLSGISALLMATFYWFF